MCAVQSGVSTTHTNSKFSHITLCYWQKSNRASGNACLDGMEPGATKNVQNSEEANSTQLPLSRKVTAQWQRARTNSNQASITQTARPLEKLLVPWEAVPTPKMGSTIRAAHLLVVILAQSPRAPLSLRRVNTSPPTAARRQSDAK